MLANRVSKHIRQGRGHESGTVSFFYSELVKPEAPEMLFFPPPQFLLQPFPEHHLPVDTSNPREEHFDKVSPTIPEGFPRGPA